MISQHIEPQRNIFFAGETVRFTLKISSDIAGRAIVRTNAGHASLYRKELIEHTENSRPLRNSDWYDIEMIPGETPGIFTVMLPLTEVGIFEAKCCFLPADGKPALWPDSGNFHLKVEPAVNIAGNGIYCAFVRQWNSHINLPHSPALPEFSDYDDKGFIVVPPSGTFRKLAAHLDHIFGTLNCRILQLLPIHPVPVAYGRMGRYGSPFAATDYFAVDPALAEFDEKATPMEQFEELIDAVHRRRGRIFMDIPVNHTGWASKLQCEHPDYFVRTPDKKFESPGAWGIVWADLCKLDYSKTKVHELMAKVFLFWCRRGVDGFRCDAGYMVPAEAWNYIIAKVRNEYPDTVFLLEGLGGPLTIQEQLMEKSGLNWGYSELFQNYSRDEISHYYPYMNDTGNRIGTLANFAETHDNDRLAAKGKSFARLRFMVTALLSQHGTFGFANGAEFYATEKIDVHGCGALNFGNPDNLTRLIGKLNALLATHPAFGVGVDVKLIQRGEGNCIAAWRSGKQIPPLLVLLNLECHHPVEICFSDTGFKGGTDLITGEKVTFENRGNMQSLLLTPGNGYCIGFDEFNIEDNLPEYSLPETVCSQCAAVMAQNAAKNFVSLPDAANADGEKMRQDPMAFAGEISGQIPPPVTVFRYPEDCRRLVMLPPGDLLLVRSKNAFSLDVKDGQNTILHISSLPMKNGVEEFALVTFKKNDSAFEHQLELCFTAFENSCTRRISAQLLQLPDGSKRRVRMSCKHHEAANRLVFGSNAFGSYALFNADFGNISSKYNAILAANTSIDFPDERRIMFTNCRAWLVTDEFSQELSGNTLEEFTGSPDNHARLQFALADGRGGVTKLAMEFIMLSGENRVLLRFKRLSGGTTPARLILRPDLEDRINHTVTRACDGAEHLFRHSVTTDKDGFEFHPGKYKLSLKVSRGEFFNAPEWRYMVDLPAERNYGLPDKTDLFSPGYFSIPLNEKDSVILSAATAPTEQKLSVKFPDETEAEELFPVLPSSMPPERLSIPALSRFIVKRDGLSSVIAGYPWFLDWGRDTLIVLRGLLKFRQFQPGAARILRRFAAFERNGTIPNMICGGNDSNRDTSDAPLYLILAAKEYIDATGDREFINADCGGRTLKEVIDSIIYHCKNGTSNGIVMDAESKMLFSPSHFSWMDTNHPAGTPRKGYPIEIQSLWYAALEWHGENELAGQLANSIEKYFFSGNTIADCLHCEKTVPAGYAIPDDHLRCNILTAITLGAVRKPELCCRIIEAAGKLLIPGAVRTLDDTTVTYHLPVYHNGNLLNDPAHPYQGHYCGAEDTKRKPAYHNGTAWIWPFPAYCEALYLTGNEKSRSRALSLLMSCIPHFEQGITGQLPEVMDGNIPHRHGGCPAQAWSVSEFFRVLAILEKK